jgi:hypothetical protein
MSTTETRYIDGTTSEGHAFSVQLCFAAGAPNGVMPIEIACSYGADDGPGTVVLSKRQDGLYAYADEDSLAKYGSMADANPNNLLPCVVVEGTWGGQQQ